VFSLAYASVCAYAYACAYALVKTSLYGSPVHKQLHHADETQSGRKRLQFLAFSLDSCRFPVKLSTEPTYTASIFACGLLHPSYIKHHHYWCKDACILLIFRLISEPAGPAEDTLFF